MNFKKCVALTLVVLLSLGQVLTAFAQMGVQIEVRFDDRIKQLTVSGEVYSDTETEPAGKNVRFELMEQDNQSEPLINSTQVLGSTPSKQLGNLYYYDFGFDSQEFTPEQGKRYSYNVYADKNLIRTEIFGGQQPGDPGGPMEEPGSNIWPGFENYNIKHSMGLNVNINYEGSNSLEYIQMDGVTIAEEKYILYETSVEISHDYLNTLNLGEHTVTFKFTDVTRTLILMINDENPSGFQSLTFDFENDEKYVEFKTPAESQEVAQFGTAKRIRFEIRGMLPDSMFSSNGVNLNDVGSVLLIDADTGLIIPTGELWGGINQKDENGHTERLIELSLDLAQEQGLNYDTTYRLRFTGELLNEILKGINSYTYIVEGMDSRNIILEVETGDGRMTRGEVQLNNDDVDSTTLVSVMELGDEGSLGVNNNYVAYDIDFTKGFNDVKKVVLFAEGNWPSQESIDTSEDISTFGQIQGVTTSYSITDSQGYAIKMEFNLPLPSGQDFTEITTLQSYGRVANEFANAVKAYSWDHEEEGINYRDYKGSKYLLVYNSLDEVIGWKALGHNVNFDRLYANPQMQWVSSVEDTQTHQWVYTPYTPEVDVGTELSLFTGLDNSNPNKQIKIANSGTRDRLILNGTVTYGETEQTFDIITESSWEPGDEGSQYVFLDFKNINHDDFAWENVRMIEGQAGEWHNRWIPVNPIETNTISLSYKYEVNNQTFEGTKEFMWKLDSQELANMIIGNLNIADHNNARIGIPPEKASLTFRKNDTFEIDIEKLKLYIYYNGELLDNSPSAERAYVEGESKVCAVLSAVDSRKEEPDEFGNVDTYITFEYNEENGDVYTIGDLRIDNYMHEGNVLNDLTIGEWQALGQDNRIRLRSMLVYTDGDVTAKRDASQGIEDIEIDALAPSEFDTRFKGEDTSYTNRFKVKIRFHENIDMQSVSGNVCFSIKDINGTITDTPAVTLEPVHDHHQRDSDPYQAFIATFECDRDVLANSWERKVVVNSVSDLVGNTSVMPIIKDFHVDTQFRVNVYDNNGIVITDSEISLIKTIPLPVITDNPDNSWESEQHRFQTNNKGIMEGRLIPGKYYGYMLSQKDDKGRWIERNVDFEFEVPFADGEINYYLMPEIRLPAENVNGSVQRHNERSFKEEIVFIDNKIYNDYVLPLYVAIEKAIATAEPIAFERCNRALDIIERFYAKTVKTDMNGNFSTYLKPGVEYRVLGKRITRGKYIEPEDEYIFTLTDKGYEFLEPIKFPPPVFTGKLVDHLGNPMTYCTIEMTGHNGLFLAETDDIGCFDAYINKAGSYRIVMVKSGWNGGETGETDKTGRLYVINASFDVDVSGEELKAENFKDSYNNSVTDFNNLQLPETNVTFRVGKDRDSDGKLIQSDKKHHSIRISTVQQDGEEHQSIHEVDIPSENGNYQLYIPVGTYKLEKINSNDMGVPSWWNANEEKFVEISMNGEDPVTIYETVTTNPEDGHTSAQFEGYNFTVSEEVYSAEYGELIEIDLRGYFDTVITFVDDEGNPMEGIYVSIENVDAGGMYNVATDSKGRVYFYFGINDDNGQEVTNKFRVHGYNYNRKWYPLEDDGKYQFTVSSGCTPLEKAEKEIIIYKPNFYGVLYNNRIEDGQPMGTDSQPVDVIESGWLDIIKLAKSSTEPEKRFSTGTDIDGNFSMAFNEEGQYIVQGTGFNIIETNEEDQTENKFYSFDIGFRFDIVMTKTGKFIAVYPQGHDLEGEAIPMGINLGRPSPNFYGYLFKKDVYEEDILDIEKSIKYKGYDGTETWKPNPEDTGVNIILVEDGVNEEALHVERWKYEKSIRVQEDGSFEGFLDISKTYKVWGVSTLTRWYEYGGKTIIDPKSQQEYIITFPQTNFSGQAATFDKTFAELRAEGIKFLWGSVYLEKADKTDQEWVEIDEDGFFGKDLEEGVEYKINDFNFELGYPSQETESLVRKNFNFRVGKLVTPGSSEAMNMNLRPNFKATIYGLNTDIGNMFNNQVGVTMRRVLDSEDPNFEDYTKQPYKYEIWSNGIYTPAENDKQSEAVFYSFIEESTELKNIRYAVVRVHDTDINETFVVAPDTKYTESGQGEITVTEGRYELILDFVPNVIGRVSENGTAIKDAWINIREIVETGEQSGEAANQSHNQFFGTKTDLNGEFALKLGDGIYRIDGYNGKGEWVSGKWHQGQWVQVGYEFQVIDGEMYDKTGTTELESILLDTNVTGKIMRADKTSETGYTQLKEHAWLQIWPADENGIIDFSDWSRSMRADTNADGIFKMTLLPGKYKVTEAGGINFHMRLELPFEINSQAELVMPDPQYIEDGYFIVKPQKPNLFGTAYRDSQKTTKLINGNFIVKPKAAKQDDWSNAKWIKTDYEGNFSTFIDDGEWIITEMGTWNFRTKVTIPLKVEGDLITSLLGGFDVDPALGDSIYPPEPNVKGVIIRKDGEQLNDKGWIVIKPSDAAEHDWSSAIWTEYRHYPDIAGTNKNQFRVTLEPGSYKIAEAGGGGVFYKADIKFTVGQDMKLEPDGLFIVQDGIINVNPPEPNVTGTAFIDSGNEERPVRRGWINIARYADNVQVSMNGQPIPEEEIKDPHTGVYWHHTAGFEINDAGLFEANLDTNATYRVISVGGEGGWYQPNSEITLTGDEKVNVEVRKPGPNVTITIKDIPKNIETSTEAWLDVFFEKDGFKQFIPTVFIEKTQENDFVFKASMKDGSYKIAFLGTPDGKSIEIDTNLEVEGTTNTVVNLKNSNNHAIIEGTVTNNGNPVSNKVWVAVTSTNNGETIKKKTQTDENGKFVLKLPHNTVWNLVEVVTDQEYIGVSNAGASEIISIVEQNTINWSIEINEIKAK